MLPRFDDFVKYMKELGINASDAVITYDDQGMVGGTRALWMLDVYGAKNVKVINGGFPNWKDSKKPVENGEETWLDDYKTGGEGFAFVRERLANINDVREVAHNTTTEVELVDARQPAAFNGETRTILIAFIANFDV